MKGCRPLQEFEVRRVAETFQGPMALRDRCLFLLGVKSGFRISEILSLRLGAIYQFGRVVERVTVERRFMKRQLEGRTVLLHPEARRAVAAWVREMRRWGKITAESPVFFSHRNPMRAISRISAYRLLKEVFRKCKMPGKLGTHCMRKTFAARVYENLGHDLFKTQRALGHQSVDSTVHYLSFRQEEIDAAILAL